MKSILALSLMLWVSVAIAQELPHEAITFAEEQISQYAQDYPGVSVSISKNGKIAWQKTAGYQDLDKQMPVKTDTRFNIYSTSKLITGLAFLKLVHEGKIKSIDQKIREIDPDLPKAYKDITIRHLLTHTSGIRHYKGKKDWISFSNLRCQTPAEAIAYFSKDKLKAKPGKKYRYTTFGMVVASHILEKITGRSYIDALNDLLPLSTPLVLDDENIDKAVPYIKEGKEFEVYTDLNAECKFGGGGLIASSNQLAEVGQLFYNGFLAPLPEMKKLLSTQWQDENKSGTSYAMRCGIAENNLGVQPVLYANIGGASPGGRSYLLILADLEVAVAITTNCEGDGEKAYQLAIALAQKFSGMENLK